MGLVSEFKEFAVKGNAVDMAVGIIIGAAFSTVVKSLVDDIIMPPIGKLFGDVDFSNLFINLSDGSFETLAAAQEAGAATINYGLFINAVISFLIVGWALFLIVRSMNKLQKPEPESKPTTKQCNACKEDIHLEATKCAHCTADVV